MVKPAQLRAAFRNDLAAAWNRFKELHPKHTPYAFVLYGVEGTPQLSPHVLTEESLTEKAPQYVADGSYDTLKEAREGIRYSVADSPLFSDLEKCFANVDALMKPHEDKLDENTGYALLAKAAMDAFEALDKQGVFGTGKKREQLLLMIITEDVEKDWSNVSAKRLNSRAAYRRFEAATRIEGNFASSDALVVSRDGRSLYSACGREVGNKDISEMVAYDIQGVRLKRRWAFTFPSFGDSGKAVACSRDGASVLMLRAKYQDEDKSQTFVMRFGRNRSKVLAQTEIAGEPASFALAHDGSRIAVALQKKQLHVLDEKLQPVQTLKLKSQPWGIRYLRSGELLVTTDGGLLRMDSRLQIKPTPYRKTCFNLAIDDSEKILAIGRWFAITGSERKQRAEFGIQLLRLPSLKPLRTVFIAGHQLVHPALSPDGKHLAFEAHQVGAYRYFVAIIETATGREIARRKSNMIRALEFLRDGKTLAIAGSGFTTSEPVLLWTFGKAAGPKR